MAPSITEIAGEKGVDVGEMVGQTLTLNTEGAIYLNLDFYLKAEPGEKVEVVDSADNLVRLKYPRTGREFKISKDKDYFRGT